MREGSMTDLSQEVVPAVHVWRFRSSPPGAEIGATLEGASVRRGGDDARHTQGLTKVPRHIPRLALRASSSAAT